MELALDSPDRLCPDPLEVQEEQNWERNNKRNQEKEDKNLAFRRGPGPRRQRLCGRFIGRAGGWSGSVDTSRAASGGRDRPFDALQELRRCPRAAALPNSICGTARPTPRCLRGSLSSAR